jgi:hypothetical protein
MQCLGCLQGHAYKVGPCWQLHAEKAYLEISAHNGHICMKTVTLPGCLLLTFPTDEFADFLRIFVL